MADIFISYKREERASASELATALAEEGWSVWWDLELVGGERFDDKIEEELNAAGAVVVLWSLRSVVSDFVKDEATRALKLETLVPARIELVDPPLRFDRLDTIDLIGWNGDRNHAGYRRLRATLVKRLGEPPAKAQDVVSGSEATDDALAAQETEPDAERRASEAVVEAAEAQRLPLEEAVSPPRAEAAPRERRTQVLVPMGAVVVLLLVAALLYFLPAGTSRDSPEAVPEQVVLVGPLSDTGAERVVRDYLANELAVLGDPSLSTAEAHARLLELASAFFDYETMARLTVARGWRGFDEDQRNRFLEQFRRSLTSRRGDPVEQYQAVAAEVRPANPELRGDLTVPVELLGVGAAEPIEIRYRLRGDAGSWRAIDRIVAGASFTTLTRARFSKILERGGPEALIDHVREINENLAAEAISP